MSYSIQRLSLGGILDQSFQLLRDHFVPMTLGFVLIFVPQALLSSVLGLDNPEEWMASGGGVLLRLGAIVLLVLVMAALLPLIQLAANHVIADAYLSRPGTLGSAFARAKRLYLPYLGTSLLMGVLLFFWAFLLLVPMVYFAVCWLVVGPIAVVEETFGMSALRRSRSLVQGRWWRTLGVLVVSSLITFAISYALGIVFAYIPVVGAILGGAVQGVASAYQAVVLMVLYVDLRCRNEDFDLRLMAERVAASDAPAPPAGAPS